MSLVKYVGTYRGYVVEKGIGKAGDCKLPQLILKLKATEFYDEEEKQWIDFSEYEENEITAYLILMSKANESTFHVDNIMKTFDWSGDSFKELDEMDVSGIPVQFRVEEDTYKGKTSLKVSRIDHTDADPSSAIRKLDVDEVKKLDAKYATALRKKSGGPKPKSVPAKPVTPETEVQGKAKAAAKKKHDEKKVRGKAAEEKAAPKPAPAPKPPVPGKPEVPTEAEEKTQPTNVAEALKLPAICAKAEAWQACWEHKTAAISDEKLAEVWNATIDEQGGEDAIDKENLWANVRNIVLEQVGEVIPF